MSAKEVDGTLVGEYKIISQDTIATIIRCLALGIEFIRDWEQAITPSVDRALYERARPQEDPTRFLKVTRMKPKSKFFHNLLFNIVFPRLEGGIMSPNVIDYVSITFT